MSVITTGTFPKLLRPGIADIFGAAYNEYPPEYTQIFEEHPSDRSYEEDVLVSMTGQAVIKPQGFAVTYDSMRQGYVPRYTHVLAALGYIITLEERMDNLYPALTVARQQALARSLRDLKEQIGSNVLNDGFTNTGADGVSLFDTDHPVTGGVQSNILDPSVPMSEAALEQIDIALAQAKNDKGMPVRIIGRKIIVPPALKNETQRILGNPLRPGTAERDINAMYQMGAWPDGFVVNRRLSSDTAFFVITDCFDGFKYYNRMAPVLSSDNDFDTENEKNKAIERYSFGYSDFRAGFASTGI